MSDVLLHEPIAIVGMGCRFPGGGNNPSSFWNMLLKGVDAITEIPKDRWNLSSYYSANPKMVGKSYARHGAFLNEIDQFDASFFGISPREAMRMDPQQRLLLELAWEAFEDAGLVFEEVSGSNTGVYVGVSTFEYASFYADPDAQDTIDAHTSTGSVLSIAANRLSYFFDLRGPSVVVDTACSSSLVAVHHACESIWYGGCDMALAAGVQLNYRPDGFIVHSKSSMLSPTGRCYAFDDRADGFVRGEGGGVLVLKPLRVALENEDEIYAVIRGSALNQDGRTNSITMPSETAQVACIQKAHRQAGVAPHTIQYIEAHGPGTALGDPIETRALGTVLREDREIDCVIGSVKTNIGHLEAASGIAGLIKLTLALKHRQIPPNLNFKTPNPDIPFDDLRLRVPVVPEYWPENVSGVPRLAGINSFGFGGTNAHIIVGEAPQAVVKERVPQSDMSMLVLSARSEQALADLAKDYAEVIQGTDEVLADICYSAANHRTHHEYRLAVVADGAEGMVGQLTAFGNGEQVPNLVAGQVASDDCDVVFVCSGMGQQWANMGRSLYEKEPVFRDVIQACDAVFQNLADWSLVDVFTTDAHDVNQTEVAQVAIFALQAGLSALWQSWGVVPKAVVGHSVGEVAAAYIAGALDLDDAIAVVYHRSRLQATVANQGSMLAVGLSEADVLPWLDGYEARISIAAINSPKSVTLAGETEALEVVAEALGKKEIFHRFLQVEVPYHSPLMNPLMPALEQALSHIKPQHPTVPLYSTVTGRLVNGNVLTGSYWAQNMRAPVRFADAVGQIAQNYSAVFVEISAHPVLGYSVKECLKQARPVLFSLRREQSERQCLLTNLGELYCLGHTVRWAEVYPKGCRFVNVPTYPWQKTRYWIEKEYQVQRRIDGFKHPLLGRQLALPTPTWETEIDLDRLPYLRDHSIKGDVVFPSTAYLEIMLSALHDHVGEGIYALRDIKIEHALLLENDQVYKLQVGLNHQAQEVSVYSHSRSGEWIRHAACQWGHLALEVSPDGLNVDAIRKRCPHEMDGQACYEKLSHIGYHYGPCFQGVSRVWYGENEALFETSLPEEIVDLDAYYAHPAVIDAYANGVLSVLVAQRTWVPVHCHEVVCYQKPTTQGFLHMQVVSETDRHIQLNLTVTDEMGNPCFVFRGLHYQALDAEDKMDLDTCVYHDQWHVKEQNQIADLSEAGRCFIFADVQGVGEELAEQLGQLGAEVVRVPDGDLNTVSVASYREIVAQVKSGDHLIYLSGLGASDIQHGYQGNVGALYLTQALAEGQAQISLWFVTQNAQAIDNAVQPEQTALWGLGRVIANEYPQWRTSFIDVGDDVDVPFLAHEILLAGEDTEVAFRKDQRYVQRLLPLPLTKSSIDTPFGLTLKQVGSLEHLRFERMTIPEPGPDEVVIQVCAAGLNFKDVVKTMGMIDAASLGQTMSGNALGFECAGYVQAVGEGVTQFKAGDAVVAVATGCFATYTKSPANLVAHKPNWMTFEEAATVPVAYLTAYSALVYFAQLKEHERILIHSASGGVGQAAIHIAKTIGAQIYATAGSDEKRNFLRAMDLDKVMHSRTLTFGDEIKKDTQGSGVDVVLNALPPRTISTSLSVLKPRGRFVDLSNFYTGAQVDMRPFQKGLSLIAFDLDQLMQTDAAFVDGLFQDAMQFVHDHHLPPISQQVFPIADVQKAFRHMAQAQHIGKVVVDVANCADVSVYPSEKTSFSLDPEGVYLVTGGLRGFGLATAHWLVAQGAKHLALVSRSGATTPEAQQAVADLQAKGVGVHVFRADVSRFEDLQTVFEQLPLPLRGVVHAAAVYDDQILLNLTEEAFARVMAPKAWGAWHLHTLTRDLDLDLFVLYSSVAATIGNPGQGNYAAANSFLDGLADLRRQMGLPVLCVNWGGIGEVGYLARAKEIGSRLTQMGIDLLRPEDAFSGLDILLQLGVNRAVVAPVAWARIAPRMAGLKTPRFAQLVGDLDLEQDNSLSLRDKLVAAAPETKLDLAQTFLCEQIAQVLGVGVADLDKQRPLTGFGLDSLMAVELSQRLIQRAEFDMSPMKLLGGLNLEDLAELMVEQVSTQTETQVAVVEEERGTGQLSLLQMPIWNLHKQYGQSSFYNLTHRVRLVGKLNVGLLERCLQAVVARHQILNTVVREEGGKPVQEQIDAAPIVLPVEDLCSLSPKEQDAAVTRLLKEEAVYPMDLLTERPLRVRMIQLGEQEHVLCVTLHHLVADGTALRRFFVELFALYEAEGMPTHVPHLPLQYADFAQQLQVAVESEEMDEHRAFWKKYLAGVSTQVQAPTDYERPDVATLKGKRHRFHFPQSLNQSLKVFAQAEKGTLFMALLSGLAMVVHQKTNAEDFCLGTFVANRKRANVRDLVGCFINAVPIRIDLSDDLTNRAVLRRVRDSALQVFEHSELPYVEIKKGIAPDVSALQVVLILHTEQEVVSEYGGVLKDGLEVVVDELYNEGAKRDWTFHIYDSPDGLVGDLEYDADLFNEETIAQVVKVYQTFLETMCAHPDKEIDL